MVRVDKRHVRRKHGNDFIKYDTRNAIKFEVNISFWSEHVSKRLADWANGKEDVELDKFYETAYQGDTEKISPKALKKSNKSGIIQIQNNNSMGQIKESMTEENDRSANGMRKSPFNTLSDAEITHLKNEIKSIQADENVFSFNEGSQTSYNDLDNIINIRGDVFPDKTSIHARDLMSERAVLAHEYYGYYKFSPSKFDAGDLRDEMRASYIAAIKAPKLSEDDRRYLMIDAYERAKTAGYDFKYSKKARELIYGY